MNEKVIRQTHKADDAEQAIQYPTALPLFLFVVFSIALIVYGSIIWRMSARIASFHEASAVVTAFAKDKGATIYSFVVNGETHEGITWSKSSSTVGEILLVRYDPVNPKTNYGFFPSVVSHKKLYI